MSSNTILQDPPDIRLPDDRQSDDSHIAPVTAEPTGPVGIGGWLILPILGLIGSTGLTVKNFIETPWNNIWIVLQSDSPQLAPLKGPMLFSFGGGVLLILGCTFALIQIFRHSPKVPKIMTIVYIGMIIISIGEAIGDQILSSVLAEPPDPSVIQDLVRVIIGAAIWIPYFRTSKRVANTFKSREAAVNRELDKIFS